MIVIEVAPSSSPLSNTATADADAFLLLRIRLAETIIVIVKAYRLSSSF